MWEWTTEVPTISSLCLVVLLGIICPFSTLNVLNYFNCSAKESFIYPSLLLGLIFTLILAPRNKCKTPDVLQTIGLFFPLSWHSAVYIPMSFLTTWPTPQTKEDLSLTKIPRSFSPKKPYLSSLSSISVNDISTILSLKFFIWLLWSIQVKFSASLFCNL